MTPGVTFFVEKLWKKSVYSCSLKLNKKNSHFFPNCKAAKQALFLRKFCKKKDFPGFSTIFSQYPVILDGRNGGIFNMDFIELIGLTLEEITALVEKMGGRPFRGKQLYHHLYRRQIFTWDEMTDISRSFKEILRQTCAIGLPSVSRELVSVDGSVKFLFTLHDGEATEAVYLPEAERTTLCLSTQAGCAMNCAFCATGRSGFRRNLSPGEILGQYLAISRRHDLLDQSINIVFMGMGEPLLNLDSVLQAFGILTDPSGCALSRRKITLSTCGIRDGLARLARADARPKLAVSLNATTDEVRSRIMPCNNRFPLAELLAACRDFPLGGGERITMEYILIKGVNDSLDDARRLVRLLRPVRCKINLIAYNEISGVQFRAPDREDVLAFQKVLTDAHYTAFIRKSRGQDIMAACGQLALFQRR